MTVINIHHLAGDTPCAVLATLRPGFVIVDYLDECVFAELQTTLEGLQQWEFWAGSPNAEEQTALTAAIEAHGGFDKTTVAVTPPEPRAGMATAPNFADTLDELARRLRAAVPDPKLLELAASDLEQLARDVRKAPSS